MLLHTILCISIANKFDKLLNANTSRFHHISIFFIPRSFLSDGLVVNMNFLKRLGKAKKIAEEVVNALDEAMRNSPIFLAVSTGNIDALCRAYADGESLSVCDMHGNNILHIAIQRNVRAMVRAVLVLSYDLVLWDKKNDGGKTPWDLATKELREDITIFQSDKETRGVGCDWKRNTQLVEEKMDMDDVSNEHVLLSLDGGGMKGLLELQTMLLIERRLGIPLMGVVDWIAGTSTGSIIALVLAQGRSVQWAHQLYFRLGSSIFKKGDSYVPKYSSKNLEECLIEHIGTAPLSSIRTVKVVVTASKIDTSPPSLLLLRSYLPRVPNAIYAAEGFLDPERTPIWKAARCSSAAPIYFTSCNGLADGALCTNNPCAVLISDFYRMKKIENLNGVKNEEQIHCMVSLGTGQDPRQAQPVDVSLQSFSPNALIDTIKKSTNLIQMFIMQCVSSDGPAVEYSKEWAHSQDIPFFRIQPILDKKVVLDEKRPSVLMDVLWQTEVHNRTRIPHQINQIVQLFRSIHTKRGINNNLNPGAEREAEKTPRTETVVSARDDSTSSRRAK